MRTRLIGILALLLASMIMSISVPLAIRFAANAQDAMFLDRLEDTNRFATVAGASVGASDAAALQADLTRYHDVYGVSAGIVDRSLSVLESAGDLNLDAREVASALRHALSGHKSSNPPLIWFSGRVLAVAVPIAHGDDVIGAALTVSSTSRLRQDLLHHLQALWAVDLVAIVLFTLVASRLASWVLHPVHLLDTAIARISGGDLATRAPVQRGPVELRALATSFNRMVDEVQRVMDSQQAFVANASHQLRNPLTALTLRLEAFGGDLAPHQRGELDEILIEATRLGAVVNQLLQLATIQGGLAAEPDAVDLVPVIHGRANAWRPQAQRTGIRIELAHPASAVAFVNEGLTSSILDTVLDNAVKFSPAGGRIDVRASDEGGEICVEVTDQGPGIKPDELDRVGGRFWRSPATSAVPGSGLGLSIASELAAAIGARLRFAAADPHGLRVRLYLPKAVRQGGEAG